MTRRKEKISDEALADAFNEIGSLHGWPGSRSDYALQERVVAAVESRMKASPIFRTRDMLNELGDILTLDDKATPRTKQLVLKALHKAVSAPDASAEAVWNAVSSLRTASLEMPQYARQAEKAIRTAALTHPDAWEDAYDFAGNYWNGSLKNQLRREITFENISKLAI